MEKRKTPKLGYSYPSNQKRCGPAPLASFEDLPSDDLLSSPDDSPEHRIPDLSPDSDVIQQGLDADARDLLLEPTDTVTPVNDRSPEEYERKLSSVSRETLTDVKETKGHNREQESTQERKGSRLEANGGGPQEKRKGSWTEVFTRGSSRSRSRSPQDEDHLVTPAKSPAADTKKKKGIFSFLKKGHKTSNNSKHQTHVSQPVVKSTHVTSSNETRPKNIALVAPRLSITNTRGLENFITGSEEQTPNSPFGEEDFECDFSPDANDDNVTPPVNDLILPEENESDDKQYPLPPEIQAVISKRKLKRRSDTTDSEISEVQSLPEILPSSRRPKNKPSTGVMAGHQETVVATIEHHPDTDDDEDSDFTLNESQLKQTSDEWEAANLLSGQESLDYDDSISEPLGVSSFFCDSRRESQVTLISNRKEREELKVTNPIDRPRSVTPVAIAPLEAYLRRASLSPDPTGERIKLSLPGDQFSSQSSRCKSPRKSNPQIWLDFCEKGLGSPKSKKKFVWREINDDPDDSNNPTGHPNDSNVKTSETLTIISAHPTSTDAFTPVSDAPLTPVTPLDNTFGDSFEPLNLKKGGLRVSDVRLPSSECTKCLCRLKGLGFPLSPGSSVDQDSPLLEHLNDPRQQESQVLLPPAGLDSPNLDPPESEDAPLVSPHPNCGCECHLNSELANILWQNEESLRKQDILGSASSDISSASSRLVNSSTSSGSYPLGDNDTEPLHPKS